MSNILNDLGLLASQNQFLAYFIIYAATIFLGNISAFASFWVVLQGGFGPWGVPLLLATVFLAEVSGDALWYSMGYTLHGTRLGNFIRNRFTNQHEKLSKIFENNGYGWIILSKFLYASSFPIIFTCGWVGVPVKKFLRISFVSAGIWLPILLALSVGLFSGLTPLRAISIFKRFETVFLIALASFFIADYFIIKVFKVIFRKNLEYTYVPIEKAVGETAEEKITEHQIE